MDNNVKLLKVSSRTNVGNLTSAILHSIDCGQAVELRCVGAGALNQAVKAVALINVQYTQNKANKQLSTAPTFFEDNSLTGISMKLVQMIPYNGAD